jgi:hypothetical protein
MANSSKTKGDICITVYAMRISRMVLKNFEKHAANGVAGFYLF